jgi:hypothetical protein
MLWLDKFLVELHRVSPRVVEFYKASARREAHSVTQLRFPDLVLDFPEEEIVHQLHLRESFWKMPWESILGQEAVACCLLPLQQGRPSSMGM